MLKKLYQTRTRMYILVRVCVTIILYVISQQRKYILNKSMEVKKIFKKISLPTRIRINLKPLTKSIFDKLK